MHVQKRIWLCTKNVDVLKMVQIFYGNANGNALERGGNAYKIVVTRSLKA